MTNNAKEKDTRWGVAIPVWEDARERARAAILECARRRETITYAGLAQSVSVTGFRPRSWALMALLGEVCRDEDPMHGVSIASLVVRKDTGMPGDGYFIYAERDGFDTSDRVSFWHEQAQQVWNAYAP